jgi:hypothetical protein
MPYKAGKKMALFDARDQAEQALSSGLRAAAGIIEEGFACLDDEIRRHHEIDSEFTRVCAVTLLKARNLLVAIYSLAMDGLAQEAGAILRPLIGTIEKLPYYRMDPTHVEQAIADRLPSEGKIAQKIDGQFQELRDYLSRYSSHSNFSYESLKHLINLREGKLVVQQPFIEGVFKKNLEMVFSFLIISVFEGYKSLQHAGHTDDAFQSYLEDIRGRGYSIIPPD